MPRRIFHVPSVPDPVSPIPHAVVAGGTCHISGQLSTDDSGYVPGTAEEEADRAMGHILADAAHMILTKPSDEFTGQFVIDEPFLRYHGVEDFAEYAPGDSGPLAPDFFLPDEVISSVPTELLPNPAYSS